MRIFGALAIATVIVAGALAFVFWPAHPTVVPTRAVDAGAQAQVPAPAGPVYAERVAVLFGVYHLSHPKRDPDDFVHKLVHKRFAYLESSMVIAHPPPAEFAPPTPDLVDRFGFGLSENEKARLQKAPLATAIGFRAQRSEALRMLHDAQVVAMEAAAATDGLIWDEETRQIFTPAAWKTRRIDSWTTSRPDVRSHITIHAYPSGSLVRSITLGMNKFGLPDIVVEAHTREHGDSVARLINLVCQTLVEKGRLERAGVLHVTGEAGDADVELVIGKPDRGDPENRIWEIAFSNGTEGQDALLSRLLGAKDKLSGAKADDEELTKARDRARSRLPVVRGIFKRGLGYNESLNVKAPFRTRDGGVEYMWIEVTAWDKGKVSGVLLNDPYYVDGLKSGAKVSVDEAQLYDYMLRHADGSVEGNETGKILLEREKAR